MTSKKGEQDAASSEKHKTLILLNFMKSLFFLKLNFVKSPFPHIEFCEETVFLILNFVKSLFL